MYRYLYEFIVYIVTKGPDSMTGADCNVDCGDNSASEDEEPREPLNQVNLQ